MKRSELKRKHPLRSSRTPIRSVGETKRKKVARYRAHLRSAYFRALRLERFRFDGWQCVELNVPRDQGDWTVTDRCPVVDESQTGVGLEADHETYARFGHERIEDLRTRCTYHHRRRHALQGKRVSA